MAILLQFSSLSCSIISLFNDIFVALPMVLCTLYLIKNKTSSGCFWFIVASSLKIGANFYLPATLLIVAKIRGLISVVLFLLVLIGSHIIIAIPFIFEIAGAYFGQNFYF